MAVPLSADVLSQYERFSLYNSPYVAHDRGCAIDLYPGPETDRAPSPVAGEVLDTRTVEAPPKPYAAAQDHLILVDCGKHIARILHVDPAVEPGDRVAVGDSLGKLVRAGFFAPWVSNHIHLGFRERDANPYRASGSLPIVPEVSIEALAWNGSGTVTETGETYAILDSPAHPHPGTFAGIAGSFAPASTAEETTENGGDEDPDTTTDRPDASNIHPVVLDGGLPHYDGGAALPAAESSAPSGLSTDSTPPDSSDVPSAPAASETANTPVASDGRIDFLGTEIGVVSGRDISWQPVTIRANDRPITGLSLFCAQNRDFGVKLVCPDTAFERGEDVTVSIHSYQ
ncbi:hypothetical protein BRC86_05620 [Halobacteriales archaeon QS_3_64_16]|nr:MAG: hypothetical protein BRC86_05620 [Halobacteriales archaeon QS_3_64_16]